MEMTAVHSTNSRNILILVILFRSIKWWPYALTKYPCATSLCQLDNKHADCGTWKDNCLYIYIYIESAPRNTNLRILWCRIDMKMLFVILIDGYSSQRASIAGLWYFICCWQQLFSRFHSLGSNIKRCLTDGIMMCVERVIGRSYLHNPSNRQASNTISIVSIIYASSSSTASMTILRAILISIILMA